MAFDDRAKLKALAIVHVFETSKPLGDYTSVAVLSDGAGISYGVNQFTHKSGSLAAVLDRFAKYAGAVDPVLAEAITDFRSGRNIEARSANLAIKKALKAAGSDLRMQRAQREIAFEKYMKPAITACEGSGFTHPLSLAVIYDSINQGSYPRCRDRVNASPSDEKAWIKEYCYERLAFLANSKKPVVRSTVYRPRFFLTEIGKGNWNLDLPMTVQGVRLSEKLFTDSAAVPAGVNRDALTEADDGTIDLTNAAVDTDSAAKPPTDLVAVEREAEPLPLWKKLWKKLTGWAAYFGGLEGVQQQKATLDSLGLSIPVTVIKYAVAAGLLAFVVWLVYEIVSHLWERISKRWLTTALVAANATPTNTVIVAKAENLPFLEAEGWTVVTRK